MRVDDYPPYILERLRMQRIRRLRRDRSKFIPDPQISIFDLIKEKSKK